MKKKTGLSKGKWYKRHTAHVVTRTFATVSFVVVTCKRQNRLDGHQDNSIICPPVTLNYDLRQAAGRQ